MKKGIIQIFVSNIIFLLFGMINNFILPKFLSVDAYANFKTYILYMSYAAFFSFGYIEGAFLKYGGKSLQQAKESKFGSVRKGFIFSQLIVCTIILLLGVYKKDSILVLFSISIFTTNMLNFYKNFCTAIAEYKIYSIITSFEKIFIFIANTVLIFILKSDDYIYYVLVLIVTSIIEIIYVNEVFKKRAPEINSGRINVVLAKECMKLGIILLLGNSVSALFTGIDQWFVKLFMDNASFATYAFAVSMERIITVFITPITTVLYNYFCRQQDEDHSKYLREALLMWAFAILIVTFPLIIVVERFMPQYTQSIDLIAILFCGQAINCIINGIYINRYKANKQQNKFLLQMIVMTVVAVALDAILFAIFQTLLALAVATLATKCIWLIWCEMDAIGYAYSVKGNIFIFVVIILFICCVNFGGQIDGAILYVVFLIIMSVLSMKETLRVIRNELEKQISRVMKKERED